MAMYGNLLSARVAAIAAIIRGWEMASGSWPRGQGMIYNIKDGTSAQR